MDLGKVRDDVVTCGRRMVLDGLVVGTSGNVSVRCGNRIVITPGSVPYEAMSASDVSVVDIDGALYDGAEPSSETPLHLAIYRHMPDAMAVVHTHSPFATVLSTVVDELPSIHYQIALLGGPVRVAHYATFGTDSLADSVIAAMNSRSAVLMRNHGAVTWGDGLNVAYRRAVTLEWLASVYYRARLLGKPTLIDDSEIERVKKRQAMYTERRAERNAREGMG